MDGAQVGVLEETHQVGLGGFLECENGGALKPNVRFEVLCDLAHEALKRPLADEKLGGFLVLANLAQRNGCFLAISPPVDLRAVCLVRAIVAVAVAVRYAAEAFADVFVDAHLD